MPPAAPQRLVSLDAYRGFIMVAMASAGLGFAAVVRQRPSDPVWQFLGYQFDHVTWEGCAFWDLIQPSFMFMVGVALPYSHAARRAKGQSTLTIMLHTIWRSLVLIGLGIFLISNFSPRTDWTFTNVLTQIGLGYVFVSLLVGRGMVAQYTAVLAILVATWLAFFLYSAPGEYNYALFGFPEPRFTPYTGLFAHWNPTTNFANEFDRWFLNLFPRPTYFKFNRGGYETLNFVPSMATAIIGIWAGEQLRDEALAPGQKLARLLVVAFLCAALGLAMGETICPIVKRIWTPSWTLFSAGWTLLILAVFYLLIDVLGWHAWSMPLVVVGMNSIAVYCMSMILKPWVRDTVRRHFGPDVFQGTLLKGTAWEVRLYDPVFAPVAECVVFLAFLWLIAWWMYRRGIFLKI